MMIFEKWAVCLKKKDVEVRAVRTRMLPSKGLCVPACQLVPVPERFGFKLCGSG
jgi:hypothetical protein